MTKTIALILLTVASFAASLGNYWITFGLWPKSWASFCSFAAISMLITLMFHAVREDK